MRQKAQLRGHLEGLLCIAQLGLEHQTAPARIVLAQLQRVRFASHHLDAMRLLQLFRLPALYGPGRSALDRVREGRATRIALPDQVFSRVHVDDIVSAALGALDAPAGAYNVADDLPASQNAVIEEACRLLGVPPPPLLPLEQANLSPMARGFYAENRRVANGKAHRVLGWQPKYPTYVEGLRACLARA